MKAQVYHPMLGDSCKWSVARNLPDWGYSSSWIKCLGDTFVSNYHYQFLKIDPDNLAPSHKTERLIREDTLNKRVYVRYGSMLNKECIIYDFSLNVGNQISLPFFKCCNDSTPPTLHPYFVDSINTINTAVGLRKIFLLKDTSTYNLFMKMYWMEGIGSIPYFNANSSFVYFDEEVSCINCFGISLICNERNNNLQFHNSVGYSETTCTFRGGNIGIKLMDNANNISIFPNPTTSTFTISKNTNEALQFHLYNLMGQQVLNKNLIESETTIERNNLAAGTYLFSITNASGRIIENGKLIFE
jgi:hypothetical protein